MAEPFVGAVELAFPPSAEHVRTARVVVVAVARRSGGAPEWLEEVRLVVGEVCARAVRRCAVADVDAPIRIEIDDSAPSLRLRVTDQADAVDGDADDTMALALVRGLSDDLQVRPGPGGRGGVVEVTWEKIAEGRRF